MPETADADRDLTTLSRQTMSSGALWADTRDDNPGVDPKDHDLAPAIGIIVGTGFGLAIWVLLLWAFWPR